MGPESRALVALMQRVEPAPALRPALAGAAELAGPVELGPVELGPVELGPVELGPAELGPAELGPVELGPVELGAVELAGLVELADLAALTGGGAFVWALNGLTVALILLGCFFFLGGTVGLLRFPDVYCRLHALTKADNLGLGCLAAGLALQAESWSARGQLLLTWLLALAAAATVCHLLARLSLRDGVRPVQATAGREPAGRGGVAP
jgi:multicomponent Na+:H+ antiporter subunit G